MVDKRFHTQWVQEPVDEKTPVSVCPLRSVARLKDTDPPPPVVTKFTHEPMRPRNTRTSSTVLQSVPSIIIQIADAAQTDTLLVARRIYARKRKIGYLLVALASALLSGALVVLVESLL